MVQSNSIRFFITRKEIIYMTKMEEYKSDAGTFAIGMTKKEIRMLLFWATVGIARSKGGMYEKIIPAMIRYFAKKLNITLPYKPQFNAKFMDYVRKRKKGSVKSREIIL